MLIAFLAVATASCSKDEDGDKTGGSSGAAVTADITIGSADTYHFAYDPVAMDPAFIGGPNQDGLYNLKMVFAEVNPIKTLTITGYFKGEGSIHSIGDSNENGFLAMKFSVTDEQGSTSHYYDSHGGTATLNITEFKEGQLKGTFSAVLYTEAGDKASIENGKFDVGTNKL